MFVGGVRFGVWGVVLVVCVYVGGVVLCRYVCDLLIFLQVANFGLARDIDTDSDILKNIASHSQSIITI